jgi:hypothetical protein
LKFQGEKLQGRRHKQNRSPKSKVEGQRGQAECHVAIQTGGVGEQGLGICWPEYCVCRMSGPRTKSQYRMYVISVLSIVQLKLIIVSCSKGAFMLLKVILPSFSW